ncbi:general secretion pathway protein [Amylibacter kogurei]|uniref:General secretion pathway protein n=1 Tax=Paramylibacter kogurei TaxID=1889778 RepID=A0A2G5K4K7_9RHOB|nr:type II and III secretion system protein family protein [Amylibacter kogurei]PIB24039.1 general secretion pathway protein [Amylibacter kogurei]
MKLRNLLAASLIGLSSSTAIVDIAAAQSTLKIMRGATSSNIRISLNRAVVMEADQPFAELSVANPGVADVAVLTDRTIYIIGKTPGRTTLTLLGPEGNLITNVEIQVAPDIAEFKERLREILPDEKIDVRTAGEGIVLSGTVSGIQPLSQALELAGRYAPDKVTNLMNVGGAQQVMLKVRFAEMSRSVSKELSASIGFINGAGDVAAGAGQAVQGSNFSGFLGGGIGGITSSNNRQGMLGLDFSVGGATMGLLLEALETKGMVRTLAEPNLTTISGKEANFLAGGEFPIPVSDGEGGYSISYRPFGVQMEFTPTVLRDSLINLVINTSVSNVDSTNSITTGGISVPAFSERRAETVVELKDGQSIAIAGLLQDNFNDVASQVPWIGDVPILGSLFRSADYARSQSELVIIVTPHLVTPVNGDSLVLPTDRVKLPTEADLFLNGKTAAPKSRGVVQGTAAGSVSSQDYKGSYGYVVE